MDKIAICPGSFDPVTLGHIDIIERASKMFNKVIVAVMVNPNKQPSFSINERIDLLKEATTHISNLEIVSFDGLLVVKGLRAVSDFEYEFQMALTNKKLNPDLETIFLTTSAKYMYLSSSMVKQVASFGGDISDFVPACLYDKIYSRLKGVN